MPDGVAGIRLKNEKGKVPELCTSFLRNGLLSDSDAAQTEKTAHASAVAHVRHVVVVVDE